MKNRKLKYTSFLLATLLGSFAMSQNLSEQASVNDRERINSGNVDNMMSIYLNQKKKSEIPTYSTIYKSHYKMDSYAGLTSDLNGLESSKVKLRFEHQANSGVAKFYWNLQQEMILKLIDSEGDIVFWHLIKKGDQMCAMDDLEPGVYFILIVIDDEEDWYGKLTKL